LEDVFAVYNPLSGDTHLLDDVTGALLHSVASGRSSETDLDELLNALVEYPDDAVRAENLRYMLRALEEIGLIEPCNQS